MVSLLDTTQFARTLTGESGFWRPLISETDFEVTHSHRNTAGQYDVPGTVSHCVTVQCSARNRYRARLGGRLDEGPGIRGDSWIKPAGVAVAMGWTRPVEVINLWITPALFDRVLQNPAVTGDAVVTPRFVGPDPLVAQIAFTLKDRAERDDPFSRLLKDSLVAALIAHLASQAPLRAAAFPRAGLVDWRLRRVLDHIEDRLADDVSLADLAAVADLSQHHFADSFRRATGKPPHRHLVERRIERAKALFRSNPGLSIMDAALAVGFATSSHFATTFRKLTGQTPSAFRDGRA